MQRPLCSSSRSSSSQSLGNRVQVTCRGCPDPAVGPAPHSLLGTEVRLHAEAVLVQQEVQLLTVPWEQRSGYMQRLSWSSSRSSSSQSLGNRGQVTCRGCCVPVVGPAPHSPLGTEVRLHAETVVSSKRSSSSQSLGNRGQVTCRGFPGQAGGPAPHSPLGTEVRLHAEAVVFQQ
jgi:hypothetical protein